VNRSGKGRKEERAQTGRGEEEEEEEEEDEKEEGKLHSNFTEMNRLGNFLCHYSVGFLSLSFPIQFQPLGNSEQNILGLALIFCSSTDGTEGGGENDRSVRI